MLPLLFFACTLAVLPLVSTRAAAALLVINYLLQIKEITEINFSRRTLTFSILATIALIVASLTAQNLPIPLALLQWVVLIWSVPLFSILIGKYGRQKIVMLILVVICFHAVWGISQFIRQRDLGLTVIGESKISIHEPAVAKVNLPYTPFKLLRAYGPYKHANSFAGVLVLGLLILGYSTTSCEGEVTGRRRMGEVLIFFLLVLALATTFSRAAIFSFLLLLIFPTKIFFRRKYFLILLIIVLTFLPLMLWRFTGSGDQAMSERLISFQWVTKIIKQNNFWQGVGLGHYPTVLKNYLDNHSINYQPWQIDFVHSAPLLILAEWGTSALLLGAAFVLLLIPYNLNPLLVTLIPILLTDHYFVTQLTPGFFLLLTFSLLAAVSSDALPYAATVPTTSAPPK